MISTCPFRIDSIKPEYECPYESYKTHGFCIFHSPNVSEKAESFDSEIRKLIQKDLENTDVQILDYKGFVFPKFELSKFKLTKRLDARFSSFKEDITFQWVEFEKGADFGQSTFDGCSKISSCSFTHGSANFDHCQFNSDLFFSQNEASASLTFRKSMFQGQAGFTGNKLMGHAHFSDCKFTGSASWASNYFEKLATFKNSEFSGDVRFSNEICLDLFDFSEAKFHSDLSIVQNYNPYLKLKNTVAKKVILDGSIIEEANLRNLQTLENFSFKNSFLISVSFSDRKLINCDFTGAVFYSVNTRNWGPDQKTIENTKYIYTDFYLENSSKKTDWKSYRPNEDTRVPKDGVFNEGKNKDFTLLDYLKSQSLNGLTSRTQTNISKGFIDIYDELYRAGVSYSDALADICSLLLNLKASTQDFHKFQLPNKLTYSEGMNKLLYERGYESWIEPLSKSECYTALKSLIEQWNNDISNEPTRRKTPNDVRDFIQHFILWVNRNSGSDEPRAANNIAIIDLAVGTGSLLEGLNRKFKNLNLEFLGQDIDVRAFYVSSALLYFSNEKTPDYSFTQADSLSKKVPKKVRQAIYLFDPPMSQAHRPTKDVDIHKWLASAPQKINSEVYFLLKVLSEAREGSWYIGLYPENIVFYTAKYYKLLRQSIATRGLRYVVKLPTSSIGRVLLIGQVQHEPEPNNQFWLLSFMEQISSEQLFEWLVKLDKEKAQSNVEESYALEKESEEPDETSQSHLIAVAKLMKATELDKNNAVFPIPQPPVLEQKVIRPIQDIWSQIQKNEAEIQNSLPILEEIFAVQSGGSDQTLTMNIQPKSDFEIWVDAQINTDSPLGISLEALQKSNCLTSDGNVSYSINMAITDFYSHLNTLFNKGRLNRVKTEKNSEEGTHFGFIVPTQAASPPEENTQLIDWFKPTDWDKSIEAILDFLEGEQAQNYHKLFAAWLIGEYEELIHNESQCIQVLLDLGLVYKSDQEMNALKIEDIGFIRFFHPYFDGGF